MLDRFRSFSLIQQILLIGAAFLVVIALIAMIWFAFLRTTYEPLFSRLRAADAATIVAELDRRKIPYELADGGSTILVASDKVDRTRLDVMSEDLPLKGTVGFELFNKSDMGITDFAQKINYQRALQGELERTIMALDGVDTARVHLSLGEDRIFRDDRVPPKASVTIRMVRGGTLTEVAAQGVRRLVAAAVPNLDIANVVILNEEGQVISAAPPISAAAQAMSPTDEEKRAIEEYYEARIRQAFIGAHLTTDVGVSVWIDDSALDQGLSPDGLSKWTPAARSFPLEVTLSPVTALEPMAQDFVRNLAKAAIDSGTGQDDVVSIGAAPRTETPPVLQDMPAPMAKKDPSPRTIVSAADVGHDWLWEVALTFLLFAFLLAGFVFAIWRSSRPRGLTEREKTAFALRLQAALREGESHVAARP